MELTWVALAGSLMMGLGAACMFIFAVKRNYFHDLEDAKYQVFWSDLESGAGPRPALRLGRSGTCPTEELVEDPKETNRNGRSSQSK